MKLNSLCVTVFFIRFVNGGYESASLFASFFETLAVLIFLAVTHSISAGIFLAGEGQNLIGDCNNPF